MLIKNTGAKVRNFLIDHTYICSFFYYLLFTVRLICCELVLACNQDNCPDLFVSLFRKFKILSLCFRVKALYLWYKCNTLIQ